MLYWSQKNHFSGCRYYGNGSFGFERGKNNLDFQIRFPLVWSKRKENEKEKRWGEWEIEEPRLKVHFLSSSSDLSKSNYSTRQRRDGKERISNYKEGVKETGRNFHLSFCPLPLSFSKRSRSRRLFFEICVSYTKRGRKKPVSLSTSVVREGWIGNVLSVVCFFLGGGASFMAYFWVSFPQAALFSLGGREAERFWKIFQTFFERERDMAKQATWGKFYFFLKKKTYDVQTFLSCYRQDFSKHQVCELEHPAFWNR